MNAFQLNSARLATGSASRLSMSSYDDQGRRMRGGPRADALDGDQGRRTRGGARTDAWDDDDYDWGAPSRERGSRGPANSYRDDGWGSSKDSGGSDFGGWDDFEVDSYTSSAPKRSSPAPQRRSDNRGGGRGGDRRSGRGGPDGWRGRGGGRGGRGDRQFNDSGPRHRSGGNNPKDQKNERSINMNALEGAGFVHLYGLSSVLNALKAGRRDLTTSHEKSELRADEEEEGAEEENATPPPPQAQFRPYLFIQDKEFTQRKGSKADQEKQALELAEEYGIPIARVDKGILNALSGNRPHQVCIYCRGVIP